MARRFDSGVDHEDDEDTLEDLDLSNNNLGIGLEDDGGSIKMSLLLSLSLETTYRWLALSLSPTRSAFRSQPLGRQTPLSQSCWAMGSSQV